MKREPRGRPERWTVKETGQEHDVWIELDDSKLGRMVDRAIKSKGKRATALRGAVVVTVRAVGNEERTP